MKTKNKNIVRTVAILLIGTFLGWLLFGGSHSHELEAETVGEGQEEHTVWTCSMHPQIRQGEPGDCPICGMELIPLADDSIEGNGDIVQMSDYAQKLANVQTMTVGAANEAGEIRLNGKVVVDERQASVQASHLPGRIEQLMVNFTGESVNRGQALARVYSPELVTAQEELLQAYSIRETNPELFRAAKDKLRRWKISENQINNIIERQQASDQFTITADVSGIVTEKLVELGDYVDRGAPIYQIANLKELWVLFDVYEGTMSWIAEGSKVEFTVASLPGETFEGTVSFVDPLLNSQTRVSTARVEVENSNGRLKPGMFTTGIVEIPMEERKGQLSVPQSAVLWTGERSVVYVKANDGFMLREVILGPSLGDAYVIKEGLEPGEEIVVNGTFKVDAAAQLAGKPSMMNPRGTDTAAGHQHSGMMMPEVPEQVLKVSEGTQGQLQKMLSSYLQLKNALVEDSFVAAKAFAGDLSSTMELVNPEEMNSDAQNSWEEVAPHLSGIAIMAAAEDLEGLREHFDMLSQAMIYIFSTYETGAEKLYVQHCPMANNDLGANWLSTVAEVKNPYFGNQMLTCGEVMEEIN